jgi:hypothetical protein
MRLVSTTLEMLLESVENIDYEGSERKRHIRGEVLFKVLADASIDVVLEASAGILGELVEKLLKIRFQIERVATSVAVLGCNSF